MYMDSPVPTPASRLQAFMDDGRLCSWRKARRTERGRSRRDHHSKDELESADALILLSISNGGFCISSDPPQPQSIHSTSDINSGDATKISTTKTPPVEVLPRIWCDEKNPLLLRIKLAPKKPITHKCDECHREFPSPQALGGHKTSHRQKPATVDGVLPDLNTPARVFQCSICGEVFDSGPALGGHKRKHYSR